MTGGQVSRSVLNTLTFITCIVNTHSVFGIAGFFRQTVTLKQKGADTFEAPLGFIRSVMHCNAGEGVRRMTVVWSG